MLLATSESKADCSAAPVGSTDDMVISFLSANGTQVSASALMDSSVKEGMLVYDDTDKTLKLCDGADWVSAGSGTGVAGIDTQVQFNDNGALAGAVHMLWDKTAQKLDVTGTVTTNVVIMKAATGSLPPPQGGIGGGAGLPAGTVAGAVQFRSPAGIFAADDTGLVWNDTTNRLGVGTAAPQSVLQVAGGVQVGDDTATCPGGSNEKLGTVRFNAGAVSVCVAGGWSALTVGGIISETDPKVGTLANNKWCTSDGSQVICNTNPPALTEVDPKIGALTSGKWCSTNGSIVTCTENVPVLTESDPKIGTLTSGKWCSTNGSTVTCTADAPATGAAGSASEVQFRNSSTGAFAADSSLSWDNTNKRLGIGTTAPGSLLTVQTNDNWAGIELDSFQNAGKYNGILQVTGRGTSASPAVIQSGDRLSFWRANGYTTASVNQPATEITAYAAANFSSTSAPGVLAFSTTPVGSVVYQERMRIDSTGNIGVGTTAPNAPLEVKGAAGGGEALRLSPPASATEGGQLTLMDASGAGGWEIDNVGTGAAASFRLFRDKGVNNVTAVVLTTSGHMTLAGSVQVSNDANACPGASSVKLGTIRFDGTNLQTCLAGGWSSLSTGGGGSSSGTAGYVQISGGSGAFSSDSTAGGQFFWDSTNHRLGIGTAAPGIKLHVYGTGDQRIKIENDGTASAVFEAKSGANSSYLFTNTVGDLRMYPNSQSGITVLGSNGNVGIGTTSPGAKLDVRGDLYVGYDQQANTAIYKSYSTVHAAANVPSTLRFSINDGSESGMVISDVRDGSYNSQSIAFLTHHGGVTAGTRMTIDKDGNVGIGTAAPGVPLHVLGAGTGTVPASSGTTDATVNGRFARQSVVTDFGILDSGTAFIQNRNVGNFATNYNLVLEPNGGNVGIGTTSLFDKLTVSKDWYDSSSTDFGGGIRLLGNAPSISFYDTDNTSNKWMIHNNGEALQFYRRPNGGGWDQMAYFNGSGDFTSNHKLSVAGTIESTSGGVKFPDGRTQSGAVVKYDSGWFSASSATQYTKAHGLGAVPDIVQLWYSDTSDGSGDVSLIGSSNYGAYTTTIGDVDATNIKFYTGSSYILYYYSSASVYKYQTTGYIKVVAIKF